MEKEIKGACHCGAVTFAARPQGRFLVRCNCSICRRLATKWLHGPPAELEIIAPEGSTRKYSWGDHHLEFHSCATCGCTTHWSSATGNGRAAVNMNLAEPEDIADMPIRHFDGAGSWELLD